MVDLALEFERPVLPLPFTGGKSLERWQHHKSAIVKQWGITESDCKALEESTTTTCTSEPSSSRGSS